MIRRINKIRNVGRFVKLRSDSGREGDFTKLNIIYGRNASGKTTLCDLFRSLSSNNPDYLIGRKRFGIATAVEVEIISHATPTTKYNFDGTTWQTDPPGTTNPRVLVYDDRFVSENVLIGHSIAVDQRRNLFGFVVGERGIALKQRVEEAEQALADATRDVNSAKTTLQTLIPVGFNVDSFKVLPVVPNIDFQLSEATNQLEAAKRTKQNIEAIKQRQLLKVIDPPAIPAKLSAILSTSLDEIALMAEMKVREHLSTHSKGLQIEWIRQGNNAQKGSNCPYCGQDMSELDILQSYKAFFSGEFQNQQKIQEELLNEIERQFGQVAQQQLLNILKEHKVEQEWWKSAGELHFELPPIFPDENIISIMERTRKTLVLAIRRKQSSPSSPIELTEDENSAIGSWNDLLAYLKGYFELIIPINTMIVDRQRAAGIIDIELLEKRVELLTAQKKRQAIEVLTAYSHYDSALTNKTSKEGEKVTANEALRRESTKIFEQYGARINELLATFQADFRIAEVGVLFSGGPPSGKLTIEILGTKISTTPEDAKEPRKPSLANTISAGDRSALAIAFFIALVENDPHLADTIVIFDDPFHSQDRSRRNRTIEYIKNIADHCEQCFVLSHELDFARDAARIPNIDIQTFKMDALVDDSILEAGELPLLPGQAYLYDYEKLCLFLQNPTGSPDELKSNGRCMRQSLESYLRHKFPNRWRENVWLGDMIESIRDSQNGDVLHRCSSSPARFIKCK